MKRLLPMGLLALVFMSGVSQAQGIWPGPDEVRAMLVEAAERHGANTAQVLAVANCESRFAPGAIGAHGERGVAQWLPGMGNAWRLTSHAREGVNIVSLYRAGDPSALWYDLDGLAQAFAYSPAQARREWSCAR